MNVDRPLLEDFMLDAINVPIIGHKYRHDGSMYECYDVHADATYGNTMLTVKAIYRRIEINGEID